MPWNVILARDVAKQLARLPPKDLDRIAAALLAMRDDPHAGDVKRLTNQPASFRRRVGSYRILLDIDVELKRVDVLAIQRRNERTYRR